MLVVAKAKIVLDAGTVEEREVSPTEFERLGGRAATKKWKQSIRILNSDGSMGRPVGEVLQAMGLDMRSNTLSFVTPSIRRPVAQYPVQQGRSGGELTQHVITSHLQKRCLGYLSGDSSTSLPAQLPRLPPGVRVVDVGATSYEEPRPRGPRSGGATACLQGLQV
jgi:SAND domain